MPGERDFYDLRDHTLYAAEVDPALTVEQIISQDDGFFSQPEQSHAPLVPSEKPTWAMIRLEYGANTPGSWRLVLDEPMLVQVTAWVVDDGRVEQIYSGGMSDQSPGRHKSRVPSVLLDLEPGQTRVLYFRITNYFSKWFPVRLYKPAAWQARDRNLQIGFGLYLGVVFAMILYNLFIFFSTGDRLYFHYVLAIFTAQGIFLPLINGISAEYIRGFGSLISGRVYVTLWGLLVLANASYGRRFLLMEQYAPFCNRLLQLLGWGALAVGVLPIFSPVFIASTLFSTFTVLLIAFGLVGALRAFQADFKPARFFLIAWTVVMAGGVLHVLAREGLVSDNLLTRHSILLGGALEGILLSLALGYRMNHLMRGKQQAENDLISFRNSLEGVVPKPILQRLLNNPGFFKADVIYQEVTIMFIDIVGYSLTSKKLVPMENFRMLRNCLSDMTEIILSHGGVIDKSLGDGFLCFFGFDFSGTPTGDHADQALRCAIALQDDSMSKILHERENPHPVMYPLRIGISTGKVCIGNMGSHSRFDFTISGEHVILANRYESACEPFKIILGESTLQHLREFDRRSPRLNQRLVALKHADRLSAAWEYDQKLGSDVTRQVQQIYWNYQRFHKDEDRIDPDRVVMRLETTYGTFQIIDFSPSGFGVKGNRFLGRNTTIEGHLLSHDPAINNLLKQGMLETVSVQVIWGRASTSPGIFRHGLRVVFLNQRQRDHLFHTMLRAHGLTPGAAAS